MIRRRCLKCQQFFTGSRCPRYECSSRIVRGYGPAHQAARRLLAASLPQACFYCSEVIYPRERWVAAHRVDGRPKFGYVVAHPTCNERAKIR